MDNTLPLLVALLIASVGMVIAVGFFGGFLLAMQLMGAIAVTGLFAFGAYFWFGQP